MNKSLFFFFCFFALLSFTTHAFQAPAAKVVARSPSTTTTARDAAISPRSVPVPVTSSSSNKPKQQQQQQQQELKVKRGEVVLDPYYGIPNGILLAAPALLALHSGKSRLSDKHPNRFANLLSNSSLMFIILSLDSLLFARCKSDAGGVGGSGDSSHSRILRVQTNQSGALRL